LPLKATQKKGAAKTATPPKSNPNPRIALIEALAAKRQAAYKASTDEAVASGLIQKEQIQDESTTEEEQQDVAPESHDDKQTELAQDEGTDTDVEQEPDSKEAVAGDNEESDQPDLNKLLADHVVVEGGKVKFKLKVDGQEQLIDREELTRDAQKLKAADARLRQAADVNKHLTARQQELDAREAKLKAREQPPASAGADDKELDAEAEEFSKLVLEGTKEEIAAATKKLLKKRSSAAPPVDEDAIVRKTRAQLAQEAYDASLVRGFEKFEKDYPEIFNDENLRAAADQRTNRISNEHPDWAPERVIEEAAKQTQQWLKSIAKPAAGGKKPLENRDSRKQNLRQLPGQRSAKNEAPQGPKPQTRSEVIAEMRKARGQA